MSIVLPPKLSQLQESEFFEEGISSPPELEQLERLSRSGPARARLTPLSLLYYFFGLFSSQAITTSAVGTTFDITYCP